ncbi:MAG TPA: oligoendopeptidase F [Nevskiaceae bacterium]|nr:oligoendopeptidase F [Nevskiaceae bacterium]
MRRMLLLAACCVAASGAARAETEADRWSLADLYPNVAAWNADADKLSAQYKVFAACQGQLHTGAARFRQCLELQADIDKRYARLETYASQLLDENTDVASSLELSQRADLLGTQRDEAESFMAPEILTLGAKKVNAYLKQDPKLAIYRHPLDVILRAAPHTLDQKGEALLASFGMVTDTPSQVYGILSSADVPWPTIKLADGSDAHLDQAGYTRYRAVQNRDDRKRVYDAFWGKWKEYERTFGVTFYARLKTSSVYARARNYPDSISAALDANHVPVAVYDTLLKETNNNLPTLHRYFKLRAKLLGVDQLNYYDIYPPIVKSDLKFPIDEGRRLMLEAVKPLGDDYVAAVAKGLKDRWMDVYPRPHKRSGAHEEGAAYDVHPLLLINYNDDYESVSTITHEWGHAMHTYLANHAQPFVTASYPIFVAEIASTLNEALLLDYVVKNAKNDDERLYYLGSALENLRATYFRQAMFADFERQVHAQVDQGQSLTGEAITKIYGDILKRYSGDAQGVVKIDDAYTVEWAYIPHFYNPYYVFQYATSIAASSQFVDEILSGKPGARERYLNLLKAGGSDDPYTLVKAAGVDLATPAPYAALAARMDRIMDQIETLLARREKPAAAPPAP